MPAGAPETSRCGEGEQPTAAGATKLTKRMDSCASVIFCACVLVQSASLPVFLGGSIIDDPNGPGVPGDAAYGLGQMGQEEHVRQPLVMMGFTRLHEASPDLDSGKLT